VIGIIIRRILPDYDVLAPRSPRSGTTSDALDLETLHAIYSKACLEPMRAVLEGAAADRGVLFADASRVCRARGDPPLRPDGRSLVNVNTPEQITEAAAWSRHD